MPHLCAEVSERCALRLRAPRKERVHLVRAFRLPRVAAYGRPKLCRHRSRILLCADASHLIPASCERRSDCAVVSCVAVDVSPRDTCSGSAGGFVSKSLPRCSRAPYGVAISAALTSRVVKQALGRDPSSHMAYTGEGCLHG